jgi:glycosyltransferase involved in cell wall biosynthesis
MLRPRGRARKAINVMLQRLIARGASKIQVFCEAEAKFYSEYYGIREDKFVWIPYCPPIEETSLDIQEDEYIFSGGLHHRDFETLYEAVRYLPLEVRIAAPDSQVPRRFRSKNMTILGKISREIYFKQMARSKLVVLALDPVVRFPGVITYVYAMRMGKCVVLNEPLGARSYLEDGKTGRIVAARNPLALHEAIIELLMNPGLRRMMGQQAKEVADREFCPQAYWRHVDTIVKTLQDPKSV